MPNLGASGAIAAVLGAYFVIYPNSTVFGLIIFFPVRISAYFFLGFWFLYQLFEANVGVFSSSANGGGVAFFAHVGRLHLRSNRRLDTRGSRAGDSARRQSALTRSRRSRFRHSPSAGASAGRNTPDRRQVVGAEAVGERDREGGRVVDTHRDQAGGQARLRRPDTSRRGDEARERRRRRVHQQELGKREVDAVRQAGGAEGERVEHLHAELAAEQLESLVPVASYCPEGRERAANRRQNLGTDERHEEQGEDDESKDDQDGHDQPSGRRPALQVARVDGDVDERDRQQNERDLDDLLRHVVDCAGPEGLGVGVPIRCRKRTLMPIRPAELGTVRLMNLIADWSTTQGSRGAASTPRRGVTLLRRRR